jgi:hypothetical protein
MHGPDGAFVSLTDILRRVNGQNWKWRLLEFYGIGVMPDDLSVDEFEDLVDASPHGVEFDWPGLLEFADSVEQAHDIVLVAVAEGEPLPTLQQDEWSSYACSIEALDSSEWVITARPGVFADPS